LERVTAVRNSRVLTQSSVYHAVVRRIQIHIEESVDNDLAVEARRRGLSKAALIRLLIQGATSGSAADPVDELIGAGDGEPTPDIDAIVYGR